MEKDIPLNIFTQIEKSIKALINDTISANKKDLSVKNVKVERSDERAVNLPSVNVAVVGGEITKVSMLMHKITITIDVLVVSTNIRSETDRRDDLHPYLFAIIKLLAGRQLKDGNGKELPIDAIYPTGRWGQVPEERDGQLPYVVKFETSLNFPHFREEEGEVISGFLLDYYNIPNTETPVVSDKLITEQM